MIPSPIPTMMSSLMPTIAAGNVNFGSNYFISAAARRKKRKAFLSPSLVWLEEEGLAAAEKMMKKEWTMVDDFIITSPEAKMNRALAMWRALYTVEKAEWKKRALEKASKRALEEDEKMGLE